MGSRATMAPSFWATSDVESSEASSTTSVETGSPSTTAGIAARTDPMFSASLCAGMTTIRRSPGRRSSAFDQSKACRAMDSMRIRIVRVLVSVAAMFRTSRANRASTPNRTAAMSCRWLPRLKSNVLNRGLNRLGSMARTMMPVDTSQVRSIDRRVMSRRRYRRADSINKATANRPPRNRIGVMGLVANTLSRPDQRGTGSRSGRHRVFGMIALVITRSACSSIFANIDSTSVSER